MAVGLADSVPTAEVKTYTISGSIVLHNNKSTLRKTLTSIRTYTQGVNFDLYLIDNASKDGSVKIAQEVYPEAKLLCNAENVGFGAAHNRVRGMLTSKYHCIINPDIILTEESIAKMAAYMDDHPEVALLSPRVVFPKTGEDQILGKRNPKIKYLVASRMRFLKVAEKALDEYAMRDADYSQPFEIENATGCFMFIRTDVYKRIGGFDERYFLYFEDCDITRAIGKYGKTLYYPYAIVGHEWARESKKDTRLLLIQIQSMFKYFSKWSGESLVPWREFTQEVRKSA